MLLCLPWYQTWIYIENTYIRNHRFCNKTDKILKGSEKGGNLTLNILFKKFFIVIIDFKTYKRIFNFILHSRFLAHKSCFLTKTKL